MDSVQQVAKLHRVNADFSPEVVQILEEIARTRGTSITDVLSEAIALEKYVTDAQTDGGRVLIERGGKTFELVRPKFATAHRA